MNRNTRMIIIVAVAALLLVLGFANSCTRINPGEAGFKISNSGDYRGVDSIPLEVGWVFYMPGFSQVIKFPTSMQHVVWTSSSTEGSVNNDELSIGCKGGAGFYLDIGMNYAVVPQKVAHIYLKFKTNDLSMLSNTYIRNTTRKVLNDLAGTYTVDSLLTNRPQYERMAEKILGDMLIKDGIVINQLSILTTPRPSDATLAAAINAKITAKQNAETSQMQLQTSIAEANKKIAEARGDSASIVIKAHGQAAANEKIQQSLTPLLIQKMWIEKWSGDLPAYMMSGSASPTMMMNIPSVSEKK
ncbi:MAG TPA: SPFH domain-containing protein [Bacteroidia bacterium]|jgi:regulator of protease activity HflC (stomatin/prohibitin superfamily)|nr:SPFH domain-containing protein [Bacteroidia bacterium]